jgi:hypothetical protein
MTNGSPGGHTVRQAHATGAFRQVGYQRSRPETEPASQDPGRSHGVSRYKEWRRRRPRGLPVVSGGFEPDGHLERDQIAW